MKKARMLGIVILLLMAAVAALFFVMNRPDPVTQIRISTNPWVGFTPFIYAQEKGWLEETPFRFAWMVDLSDNSRLYERGFTHGFTATQYEMLRIKRNDVLKPVFLIDRSYGGDAIIANRTLEEIRAEKGAVKVFMERGSMNEDFFNAFVREYRLETVPFQRIDRSQKEIMTLGKEDEAALIISYQPYLSELLKRGYRTVASTETMKTFYVIDALFVDENVIRGREKEIKRLKELFAMAVARLREDPQEYYGTIYGYLEGQSYESFIASTREIEWLYAKAPASVVKHLESQNIHTERILP